MKQKIDHSFPDLLKQGVYDAIYKRRDIRRFLSDPLPEEVLMRILDAGHQAGSVGLMQPWNFLIIQDAGFKTQVKNSFLECNREASKVYSGEKSALYQGLKLEGIEESPVNIGVTCDFSRKGPFVLGTQTMPQTALFSTCCAIQNLWLAARAEGVGMGWVSILNPGKVKTCLGIPDPVELVAYLCLGYVESFPEKPVLETAGWEKKLPLEDFIFWNRWGEKERLDK
ncbi:MAG: 5,6-dimethylbenzimidazole synthase [Nitrospirae bacterium]|nr:5,6-dimethylbenzimidazole synthase [Nitrospirota bacterium]MBI3352749.1 5,6-dimethylbenzimidazole synthase [Nitrospirota bacterium]